MEHEAHHPSLHTSNFRHQGLVWACQTVKGFRTPEDFSPVLSHWHASVEHFPDVHVWLPRVHAAPHCQHGSGRGEDSSQGTPCKELELVWAQTPGYFPHLNQMKERLAFVVDNDLKSGG